MSVLPVGIAASGDEAYTIEDSLRFRSSASAYLTRTFGTATSSITGTWSCWVKRGTISSGTSQDIWSSSNYEFLRFGTNDTLTIPYLGNLGYVYSTAVYRDPSAWYHIVLVFDTSNGTANDRMRLYVNNERQTLSWGATPQTQNATFQRWNVSGYTGDIGDFQYNHTYFFDGYLTEINWIDGQALDPTDFGEFDEDTGVWKPKAYSGSYGTNGFYLDASTSGSTVLDQSGNSNNWTANNMNLTTSSATTYDLMNDVPTLTDEDNANFCTWNPLNVATNITTTNGNLSFNATTTSGNHRMVRATHGMTSGKYYWEVNVNNSSNVDIVGISSMDFNGNPLNNYVGGHSASAGYGYSTSAGNWYGTGFTSDGTTPSAFPSSGIIGVAFDADNGKLYFHRNGTWINSADPSAGTGANFTATTTQSGYLPAISTYNNQGTWTANFGQRPFAYTPPTGFKALNTYNLPDSTIEDGGDYFNTVLYTGTGATQSITGVGFQPDLIWFKNRSGANNHALYDSVRGRALSLISNATNSDITSSTGNDLASFDSNGFTVGPIQNHTSTNGSGQSIVAWNWKANGSGVSNTVGDTNATVSANTTSGFSIVSFNAGAAGNHTVGHGLGVTPNLIIMKDRQSTGYGNWTVFHSSVCTSTSNYLLLNGTGALGSVANSWGSALPTSTVFGFGSNVNVAANDNIIAYCFASTEGFSKFGKYTGNGSTDGPFIYTGFRPAFVIVKRSNTSGTEWVMFDNKRDAYNEVIHYLFPSSSVAESTATAYYGLDFVSNGFKWRKVHTPTNNSGDTYIYAAFAENPFKNALAR